VVDPIETAPPCLDHGRVRLHIYMSWFVQHSSRDLHPQNPKQIPYIFPAYHILAQNRLVSAALLVLLYARSYIIQRISVPRVRLQQMAYLGWLVFVVLFTQSFEPGGPRFRLLVFFFLGFSTFSFLTLGFQHVFRRKAILHNHETSYVMALMSSTCLDTFMLT
jgi:hypothetical protein